MGLIKKTQQSSKLEQAAGSIKGSKVLPETSQKKWISRINLESEKSFEDQVKELETEYTDLHKSIVANTADFGLLMGW